MKPQLETWSGEFGRAYTERNQIDWQRRLPTFRKILDGLELQRVLEVGCNRGHNLRAFLEILGPEADILGIEPGRYARELARQLSPGFAVLAGSADDLPLKDASADLVFTAGVLIHIAPADLPRALSEIVRVSRRYILAMEYFSEEPVAIHYRGLDEHLWKRDFLADYLKVEPRLRVVKSGFSGREDGFDDTTWWLLEKPADT